MQFQQRQQPSQNFNYGIGGAAQLARRAAEMQSGALSQFYSPNALPQALFNYNNMLDQGAQMQPAEEQLSDTADFLTVLGEGQQGRGVNKAQQTPAEQDGVRVSQKRLFGLQPKEPVPYAKMVNDRNNLQAVLQGYQENMEGARDNKDAASIIAQAIRKSNLVGELFDSRKTNSLYSNVPKDPAVNLANINIMKQRRDYLFSIQ